MGLGTVTRRKWLAGGVAACAVGALGRRGLGQAVQEPYADHRADWMQDRRYSWGVMTHYLADWQSQVHRMAMTPEWWNRLIDGWDAEGMAKRLGEVGAGHYQLTIGQNSGYYLAPNPVYDTLTGAGVSHCSRRDLVADVYEGLTKRDIKLMVYLPAGAPENDKAACEALEWKKGSYPNRDFQKKWEMVVGAWSERWGTKVAGWWFDGCYFPNSMYRSAEAPNFASFAAAARVGNAEAALSFNPGVLNRMVSMTASEDYIAGEVNDPELVPAPRSGRVDGTQVHMLSYLGTTWGKGTPRFTVEKVVGYTRKFRDAGGSVTWDVPVGLDGRIGQEFLDQLGAVGRELGKG